MTNRLDELIQSRYGGNRAAFGRAIGVSRWSVCRYVGGDLPEPTVLTEIVREGAGFIEPNDFYPEAKAMLSSLRRRHGAKRTRTSPAAARQKTGRE